MTATIAISCDGHRHGEPCRGALPTTSSTPDAARILQGRTAGWTQVHTDADSSDYCPSPGHDEPEAP